MRGMAVDNLILIDGVDLIGCIRFVLYKNRKGYYLEADFHRDDRPVLDRLIRSLDGKVTPRNKLSKQAEEHALLDFIQGVPSFAGKQSSAIANSALDIALECQFD
jgi:hypothetical protein